MFTKKYRPLTDYLLEVNSNEIALTYTDIENIIGEKLPNSAYKYKAWWGNFDETHSHSAGWTNAGFEVANVREILLTHKVVFNRIYKLF